MGFLFSRNDASPSLKSVVQRMRAFSRIARSRSASTPAAAAEVNKRLARVTLAGLAAIKMSASSFARSISLSAGTISLMRPISFASAGEQKIASSFFSDLPRQKNGNDRGQKTDLYFRVSELCFRHSQREIAQRGDSAAARERGAVHGGDERLRKTPDAPEHFRHAP